ncbi:hypothetical protein EJA72_17700 [Pseudomonas sp. PB120]|nr:hypothetical protein [Pseudomonas sp. PB120]
MSRLRSFAKAKTRRRLRFPVGASLLAIAVGQSTLMLNVMPLSRAGSLPHGFVNARLIWPGFRSAWPMPAAIAL